MSKYAGRTAAPSRGRLLSGAPGHGMRALLLCGVFAGLPVSPANAQDAAPKAAASSDRRVDINEYVVEGNTLLPVIDIQRAVYPYEGPQRPVGDTEKARAALEKAYADRGYQAVVVSLPPQNVRGGVVHIQVAEAKIGKVTISGQQYASEGQVMRALPSARSGQVPNFQDLNRDLVALNSRSADLQVTPQLKPGSAADTIDVDLTVADNRPLHGGLELNNNYSQDTHKLRLQANLAYTDLWGLGHSVSAYYSVAPQARTDASVYVASYSAPITQDFRLSLTGLKSDSNVATVGGTGVIGRGWSSTLGGDWQLPSLGSYTHDFQAAIAYKHFTDVVSVTGQSDSAPITYYPLSLTYNGNWRGERDLLSFSGALNLAIRGIGSDGNAFDFKRFNARPNFLYFRGSASEQHDFSFAQLYLEADGQLSNQPLISNEQFSEGGNGSVRGYLQAEGLGDNGIHTSAELRTPELAPYTKVLDALRLFAFTDAARAWLISPLPQQQDDFSELGVGLGLRGKYRWINFEGDWGHALKNGATTDAGADRFYFRIYSNF